MSRSRRPGPSLEGTHPFGSALQVERWRLANGLTVLLVEDHVAPIVSYHTWFRVGSRYEEAGKTGLAHFFEHMMFNETKNLGWGEFDKRMEAAGGDTNAATWIDWTYFYESLPSETNFFMVNLGRPVAPVRQAFRERGVAVGRDFPPMLDHLRVSIGTEEEMGRFMNAFEDVMVSTATGGSRR